MEQAYSQTIVVHSCRVFCIFDRYYYGNRVAKFHEKIFLRKKIQQNDGTYGYTTFVC